jgi:preprotein translocase subunit YajC
MLDAAFAQAAGPAASPSWMDQLLHTFVLMGPILAIFYFMILRPNQRKQRETEAMLKAIKKGDRVLTSGGVFGTVVGNKNGRDDVVVLKVSDEVKMEFARQSIVQVLERGE